MVEKLKVLITWQLIISDTTLPSVLEQVTRRKGDKGGGEGVEI